MDGPFLQKLAQFETCDAPSAGTTTQNTYRLTGSEGLSKNYHKKVVDLLSAALKTRFEDAQHGLIKATSIANFTLWPMENVAVQGYGESEVDILLAQQFCILVITL